MTILYARWHQRKKDKNHGNIRETFHFKKIFAQLQKFFWIFQDFSVSDFFNFPGLFPFSSIFLEFFHFSQIFWFPIFSNFSRFFAYFFFQIFLIFPDFFNLYGLIRFRFFNFSVLFLNFPRIFLNFFPGFFPRVFSNFFNFFNFSGHF